MSVSTFGGFGASPDQTDRLRRWGAVSLGLHLAALAIGALFALARPIPEPQETGISVEVISTEAPQQAQGERPAPVPAPNPVTAPPRPEAPEQRPNQVTAPPPPPPPPPPAPAAAAAPPAPPPPRPTPPAAAQAPAAQALPPPPPAPSAQAVPFQPPPPPAPARPAPAQPQQAAPTPAPPRPDPLPLPPTPVTPPQPATTPGTATTPPVARPQERSSSVVNTLDRLRTTQPQTEAPRARPNPQSAPATGGGAPTGNSTLTAGEIRAIAEQISECWSVDAGMVGLNTIVVELRVQVDGQGVIRNALAASGSPPADPRARAVFEQARRALTDSRCAALRIPRDKIAEVQASVFRFNPRGLVSR